MGHPSRECSRPGTSATARPPCAAPSIQSLTLSNSPAASWNWCCARQALAASTVARTPSTAARREARAVGRGLLSLTADRLAQLRARPWLQPAAKAEGGAQTQGGRWGEGGGGRRQCSRPRGAWVSCPGSDTSGCRLAARRFTPHTPVSSPTAAAISSAVAFISEWLPCSL